MADLEIPDRLVKLKQRFWAADATCQAVADEPETTDEQARQDQAGRLAAARRERSELVMEIHRDSWWTEVPNRYEADKALNAKAREA